MTPIQKLRLELCEVAQMVNDNFATRNLGPWAEACERLNELEGKHLELTGREFDFETDPEWEETLALLEARS